jgi:hypothetical protein
MGIYTDSESWAVGVFHNGFYSGDRFRVRSLLGYGEFNLKYYGIGNDSILREHPIDYEAKATLFAPRVLFKLPLKNWLIGPEYFYLDIDTTFKLSRLHRILPDINIPTQTAGLGVVLVYDSRDNNLWPSKGVAFEATARDYGEYTGGDFDYEKFIIKLSQYFSLTESVIFAYRLDGQFVRGNDVPFYDLSRLRLRGLPSGSYIDNHALSAQGEVRWNFFGRWTALLFGGGGRIAEEIDDLASSQTHYAGGVGIRFMIAEKQKLNIGVDFTYADDKFEFYVQVGDWFAP